MSDFDPDKIRARLQEVGDNWADCKAAYEALDDLTKTILAEVTSNYLPNCSSKAEAEMRGLMDKTYKQHLADKAAARREWLRAEVTWKTGQMWTDLKRSQESTIREQMRIR
jgi:hypothetical protein